MKITLWPICFIHILRSVSLFLEENLGTSKIIQWKKKNTKEGTLFDLLRGWMTLTINKHDHRQKNKKKNLKSLTQSIQLFF